MLLLKVIGAFWRYQTKVVNWEKVQIHIEHHDWEIMMLVLVLMRNVTIKVVETMKQNVT